ncbi:hypothetical protein CR513_04986, partial [Mucuna pruriens]
DNLVKFDPKSDKGTFIGYSTVTKAYKVYNSKTLKVEEFIHSCKQHPKNRFWTMNQKQMRLRHPQGTGRRKPTILTNRSLGEDRVRTRLTFKNLRT